ncbi:MAG: hypothetical protein HY996_02220 [Micrococcales bacterium]|nr:hypothetical protein [Micrococcales bacterium]
MNRLIPPRVVFIALGALFSSFHVVLAIYWLSFGYAVSAVPVIIAIVIYSLATLLALAPSGGQRMPTWIAVFALAASVSLPLLVTSVLDPGRENGYGTWYVAAVGSLLTICAARWRPGFGWAGIAFLCAQSVIWAGPMALVALGVFGSAVWVGVAHIITYTLTKAERDSQRFALAEREAAEWQAAQEAHLSERQYRLGQTGIMALPMLRRIRAAGGELSDAERQECLYLEGAIRDEIRGRRLLDDDVREQVMLARRRGTAVTLLDEGGIDELEPPALLRVLGTIADALRTSRSDRMIVRTVPEGSEVAVTVVGLRSPDAAAAALGPDGGDEEVDLWLEIPRIADEPAPVSARPGPPV